MNKHIATCKTEQKCAICKKNTRYSIGQDYMIPNIEWARFCLEMGFTLKRFVCADCYEEWVGKELEMSDLTICPLNILFLQERYPKKLKQLLDFFK